LLLTKPLGNGVILTAQKAGNAQPAYHRAVCESMKRLNRAASEIFRQKQVHALTDVTGFSLLGNACEMSEKGGVKMHLSFNQLPFLDGASGYARESYFPGGTYNNQLHFKKHVAFHGDIPEEMQLLLFTPETSGGLLAAVDPEDTDALLSEFKKRNEPCWIIGHVSEGEGIEVI
jgi:selenide,water dikinase